jgi:phage repressor protein C with HTH and peptisase S24 domain
VYVDVKGLKLRVLTASVSEANEEVIEMVPEKARAGYTLGYADPEYIKVLPTFQLPFLKRDRKYRSFPISGDSMPPVSEGSHVIGEYVQNWESIKDGQPCIVITKDDGIVFKIIHKIPNKRNQLQLSSTNPVYQPYIVDVNEIIEIWKFVNYIAHDLPEMAVAENDLVKSVKVIQKQVNELSAYIKRD